MSWISIIQLVLKVVSSVADYLGNKQLLEAGEAKAISEGLRTTIENIGKANAARSEVRDNPDSAYSRGVRDKYERKDSE